MKTTFLQDLIMVLILVVVEDSLWPLNTAGCVGVVASVLILVVVEDILWQREKQDRGR